jgi:hypothetical protein
MKLGKLVCVVTALIASGAKANDLAFVWYTGEGGAILQHETRVETRTYVIGTGHMTTNLAPLAPYTMDFEIDVRDCIQGKGTVNYRETKNWWGWDAEFNFQGNQVMDQIARELCASHQTAPAAIPDPTPRRHNN